MEYAFGYNMESGVRRSVFVGVFGNDMASVAVKMFSNLIDFLKNSCKICTVSVIFKIKLK